MNLSIMQGRLLPPVGGYVQEFPSNWNAEFKLLDQYGLRGVEWLITENSYKDNPIFLDRNSMDFSKIISLCLDILVSSEILSKNFLEDIISSICEFRPACITIPLLDASCMEDRADRNFFCDLIKPLGEKYQYTDFHFETELEKKQLEEIVTLCPNFYVTYDTGNMNFKGEDHKEYIYYFRDKIRNVHLKDRDSQGRSLPPPSGHTDFDYIFKALASISYKGPYVIQTARGHSGQELETIKNHCNFFRKNHERYF